MFEVQVYQENEQYGESWSTSGLYTVALWRILSPEDAGYERGVRLRLVKEHGKLSYTQSFIAEDVYTSTAKWMDFLAAKGIV